MSATRRQRGEGSVFQRHDHPTCPPLIDGPPDKNGKPTKIRPTHKPCHGKWVGRVDLGGGKRKTVYARTQAAAIKALREARKNVDAGDTNTAGTTLEKWLTYWLEDVCPSKTTKAGTPLKPKTLRNYRSYVETKLIPILGKKRLDKLAVDDVRGMIRHITNPEALGGMGLSSTTAHHAHRILGTALNDALREGRVIRNVVELVPSPPLAVTPKDALSLNQFAALMKYLDGHRLQSRWAFGLFTGARQGECLGLTWQHLDLTNGVADLAWQLQRIPYRHGCGHKSTAGEWPCGRKRADRCPQRELDVQPGFEYRQLDGNLCLQRPKSTKKIIPLPGPLIVALNERRALYEQERRDYTTDHGLVWARIDGRPIDGRVDWAEWSDLLKALDMIHMRLHVARHTASTILLALGVEESIRMAILGHSEAATNRLYSHVDLTVQRAAMETYGAAVAELL